MEDGALLKLDPANFKKFRNAYANARDNNLKTFTFDNQEVVTLFAKYVIEMVESQTGKPKPNPNLN